MVGFVYLEGGIRLVTPKRRIKAEGGRSIITAGLYAKVGQEYRQTTAKGETPRAALIEEGGNPTAELPTTCHPYVESITDMERSGAVRPSDRSRNSTLHVWDQAFETMKRLGVIHSRRRQQTLLGDPFEEHAGTDEHEGDKILVRFNGTSLPPARDIAYQMWKLVSRLDFNYRKFYEYPDGREVWMTTPVAGKEAAFQVSVAARRSNTS